MGARKKILDALTRLAAAPEPHAATTEGEFAPGAGASAPAHSASGARTTLGLIASEWSLDRTERGAELWRHAGVMALSPDETVEVLALDRDAQARRFTVRDEWNVPAPGAGFRVRRVAAGDRVADFDEFDRARLEGAVLDWVARRRPQLVHVLDLDAFGPGVLLALEAARVPTLVTIERIDKLERARSRPEMVAIYSEAFASVERVVVHSTADATVVEAVGAERSRIRVVNPDSGGEAAVLRAYASLYRLIAETSVETRAGRGTEGETALSASA